MKIVHSILAFGLLLASSEAIIAAASSAAPGDKSTAVTKSDYVQPKKCWQYPVDPKNPPPKDETNPLDPPRPGECYLFCEGPDGERMCEYGYNRCKDGCGKQSCNPCSSTMSAREFAQEALSVTEVSCKSIPKMCCKKIEVNHHDSVWQCWVEPAGGCGNMPANPDPTKARCGEMPHTD